MCVCLRAITGPGLFFILPCIDDYSVVDLRTITYDIPPQEVLTKDSVTISVDAVLFYRIWLPTIAVSNVFDYGQATQLLTSVTLRNALGTRTLSEILSDRKKIGTDINSMVDSVTKTWGKLLMIMMIIKKKFQIHFFFFPSIF